MDPDDRSVIFISKTEIRIIFKNEELEPFYVNPETFGDNEGKLTLSKVLELYQYNDRPIIEQIGTHRVSLNSVEVDTSDFHLVEIGTDLQIIMIMEGGIVAG